MKKMETSKELVESAGLVPVERLKLTREQTS